MAKINDIFGLNDYTSMYFGATLIDANTCTFTKDSLDKLYDGLRNVSVGYYPEIFAGTLWITDKNLYEDWRYTLETNKKCLEVSRPLGFTHTSEFLSDKELLPFILKHLRWFGNDKINKDPCVENNAWYSTSVLKKSWLYSPISVQYYTKMTGNGNSPDYLYLLGGNEMMYLEPISKKYEISLYGQIKYLTLAKESLQLKHVYTRIGSQSIKLSLDYVLDELKEKFDGIQ